MGTYDIEKTDETVAQVREAINRPEVRETWQELTEVDKVIVNPPVLLMKQRVEYPKVLFLE